MGEYSTTLESYKRTLRLTKVSGLSVPHFMSVGGHGKFWKRFDEMNNCCSFARDARTNVVTSRNPRHPVNEELELPRANFFEIEVSESGEVP